MIFFCHDLITIKILLLMKIKNNTQFILDLSVSAFFAVLSMSILTFIIPLGITRSFLVGGSKAVGLVFITLSIIFLISWFFNKDFKFKKKINFPKLKDFLLLALPMSPVFNYILINTEYLTPSGLLYMIGITLSFTLFFSFILPVIFSYFASLNILMISGLALCFIFLSMPKISTGPFLFDHLFFTQGFYLIISFVVVYLLYIFDKKLTYLAVIFFMITGMAFNFINYSLGNFYEVKKTDRLIDFLSNKNNKILKKKNIYILVYESYANLETHKYYGFDNTEQIDFLEKHGFKTYHGIYSSGGSSDSSTSRTLEMDSQLYPAGDGFKTNIYFHALSGNALVPEIFKSNGYTTIGLHHHGFWWIPPIGWDEHHPKEVSGDLGGKIITKSIFEGHFRHDVFTDYFNYENYLQLKKDYLTSGSGKKNKLFYTHNLYPGHSQNHLPKCRPDEKKIHFEGLKKANIEMKNDVLNIKNNDPDSIIVLLGDHGPVLTKGCKGIKGFYNTSEIDKYDIQDRYGTFLSIHWPEDISDSGLNIMMIQDIFPAILSKITNNDNLFNKFKAERKLLWDFEINYLIGDINVINGIIRGGKDDGKPLFDKRSYDLPN